MIALLSSRKWIRYTGVRKQTIKQISEQETISYQPSKQLSTNSFGENVELLLEDGKVYYLLSNDK